MADTVTIKVNGHSLSVPAGTVLAAALAQAGISRFRQSATGEPRSVLCGIGLCFDCRVTLNDEPNSRSCQTVCENGMEVQTIQPGPQEGLLGAPASLPACRLQKLPGKDAGAPGVVHAADSSVSPVAISASAPEPPEQLARASHTCDVLVIGAGPAGIAAACVAAEAGRNVAILDSSPWVGGQIWRGEDRPPQPSTLNPQLPPARFPSPRLGERGQGRGGLRNSRTAQAWLRRLKQSGAQVFTGTTVFATSAPGNFLAETRARVLEVSCRSAVIATGAREVFLPFPGWTLPGVIGAGGLHVLAKGGWPVSGKRIAVCGSGPLLFAAAQGLKKHGAHIVCVAEQAPLFRVLGFGIGLLRYPSKLVQAFVIKASLAGVPYRSSCWPMKAEGDGQVQSVTFTNGSRTWTEHCDYLACGFHLAPNLELPMLLGCAIAEGVVQVNAFQETSVENIFCAGEPTGVGGAECALADGQIAGLAAAGKPVEARTLFRRRDAWRRFRATLNSAFALRPELNRLSVDDTIVCRCEDIRYGDVSGFENWRAAKLQTRCGMGPCQGRVCGSATHALFGWEFTSVRPPIFPVRTAALVHIGTCPARKPPN